MTREQRKRGGVIFKPVSPGGFTLLLRPPWQQEEAVLLSTLAFVRTVVNGLWSTDLASSHIYQTRTHNPLKPAFNTLRRSLSSAQRFHCPSELPVHLLQRWERRCGVRTRQDLPDGVSTNCRGSRGAENPRWFMRCSRGGSSSQWSCRHMSSEHYAAHEYTNGTKIL